MKTPLRVVGISLAALVALTGCAYGSGNRQIEALHAQFDDRDGVVSVQAEYHNSLPLPMSGGVTAAVELDDSLDNDDVAEIVHELAAFHQETGDGTAWLLEVLVDGFSIRVQDEPAQNDDLLDLFTAVRAIDGVVGGSIAPHVQRADSTLVEHDTIAVDDPARLVQVFDEVSAIYGSSPVGVSADGHAFLVASDREATRPRIAIAVFEAVSSELGVIGAELLPESASIRVATFADVAEAKRIAATISGVAGIELDVTGGTVDIEPGANGEIDDLILLVESADGVEELRADGDVLNITARDVAAILELEMQFGPTFDQHSGIRVGYTTEGDAGIKSVWVFRTPGDSSSGLALLTELEELGGVRGLMVYDRVEVELTSTSAAVFGSVVSAIQRNVAIGTETKIAAADGSGCWFEVAETIHAQELTCFGDADAEEFAADWNAAG